MLRGFAELESQQTETKSKEKVKSLQHELTTGERNIDSAIKYCVVAFDLAALVQHVWFADDATGASTCCNLKSRWNKLSSYGPAFGYHPNASKTYLEHMTNAQETCCPYRCAHHHPGGATAKCSHRLQNLYRRIHLQQGTNLV